MCYEKENSLEGLKAHEILRQKAINKYYSNPIVCKNCNNIIKIHCKSNASITRQKKFCDAKCSGKFNYKESGHLIGISINRSKKKYYCTICKLELKSKRKFCEKCFGNRFPKEEDILLKDVIYTKHHKSAAFALVRDRAKTKLKNNRKQECEKCSYNAHVECCHIKAISEFEESTPLSIINDLDNLLWLCPNHHWELDFGNLNLNDIKPN